MSTTKFKPLGDKLLVKVLEAEEKTSGGIIIPDSAKEKPQQGEVIAAGPGETTKDGKKIDMEIKAGDRVLFTKYGGTDIKLDGVEHKVLSAKEILALIIS